MSEPAGGLRRRVTDRSLLIKVIPILGVPLLTASAAVGGVYLSFRDQQQEWRDFLSRYVHEQSQQDARIIEIQRMIIEHLRDHNNGKK